MNYRTMSPSERQAELARLEEEYRRVKALGLRLDMTRGKPCTEQLDMISALGLERAYAAHELYDAKGLDCRNYGSLEGLPEARALFAEMMGVPAANVLVQGNSSLNLMYDIFARAMLCPLPGADKPWCKLDKVKVICPSPGYDRHFNLAASFGCELVCVPMTPEGPDMDVVEALLREDEAFKAMFVVPVYSNPDGYVFSQRTLKRMAEAQAARDFRVFFDNAYIVHDLDMNERAPRDGFFDLCRAAGNPDRIFEFASTSKITFSGSGLGMVAASEANLRWLLDGIKFQTIGPDKVRQLRHVNFIKENGGLDAIMARHAAILAPKFELVLKKLHESFTATELASWHAPKGGYFISVNLQPGQAKAVVALAAELGVALTPAGATFPNGLDPRDANIRIAPSFPVLEELEQAMDIFVLCVRLCALRSLS